MTTTDLLTFTLEYPNGRVEAWYVPAGATPDSLLTAGHRMLELAKDAWDQHFPNSSPEPPSSEATPADRAAPADETPPPGDLDRDGKSSPAPPTTPPMAERILAATHRGAAADSSSSVEAAKPAARPKGRRSGRRKKST